MKKMIMFIGVMFVAGAVMAVSPKIKQYVKVVTDEKQAEIAQVDVAVDNSATTITETTPAYVGQLLVGLGPTTNSTVWVAVGTTTNDWVKLSN